MKDRYSSLVDLSTLTNTEISTGINLLGADIKNTWERDKIYLLQSRLNRYVKEMEKRISDKSW